MQGKNLDYYLRLDYDITVSRLEANGEFLYKAYSRDLDPFVFYGTGETKVEAVQSFEDTKNELFERYLDEGSPIPEPTREDQALPSGKFVLRIDPRIHLKLIGLAKDSKKSLNSYVDQVLISHVAGEDVFDRFTEFMRPRTIVYYRTGDIKIQNDQESTEYSGVSIYNKPAKQVG